ncbi:hypothetical protein [Streptomyces sp. R-07]|uniref:hypothetical protein n=1 Tax=Streptomyces sp. R-07 TaxID=3404052 RepID=UPI003CEE0FAA
MTVRTRSHRGVVGGYCGRVVGRERRLLGREPVEDTAGGAGEHGVVRVEEFLQRKPREIREIREVPEIREVREVPEIREVWEIRKVRKVPEIREVREIRKVRKAHRARLRHRVHRFRCSLGRDDVQTSLPWTGPHALPLSRSCPTVGPPACGLLPVSWPFIGIAKRMADTRWRVRAAR